MSLTRLYLWVLEPMPGRMQVDLAEENLRYTRPDDLLLDEVAIPPISC